VKNQAASVGNHFSLYARRESSFNKRENARKKYGRRAIRSVAVGGGGGGGGRRRRE